MWTGWIPGSFVVLLHQFITHPWLVNGCFSSLVVCITTSGALAPCSNFHPRSGRAHAFPYPSPLKLLEKALQPAADVLCSGKGSSCVPVGVWGQPGGWLRAGWRKESIRGEGIVGACLVMAGSSGATASKKTAAALSWHSEHVKLFLLLLRVVFW